MAGNLDKEEQKALKDLMTQSKSALEIEKADKSNPLVIMTKEEYKNKLILEGHLNTETYEKSDKRASEGVFKDLVKL